MAVPNRWAIGILAVSFLACTETSEREAKAPTAGKNTKPGVKKAAQPLPPMKGQEIADHGVRCGDKLCTGVACLPLYTDGDCECAGEAADCVHATGSAISAAPRGLGAECDGPDNCPAQKAHCCVYHDSAAMYGGASCQGSCKGDSEHAACRVTSDCKSDEDCRPVNWAAVIGLSQCELKSAPTSVAAVNTMWWCADGTTNGDKNMGHCTHTLSECQPWEYQNAPCTKQSLAWCTVEFIEKKRRCKPRKAQCENAAHLLAMFLDDDGSSYSATRPSKGCTEEKADSSFPVDTTGP